MLTRVKISLIRTITIKNCSHNVNYCMRVKWAYLETQAYQSFPVTR